MGNIVLARMMTLAGAEAFERAIKGESVRICPDVNFDAGYEHIRFTYKEAMANVNPQVREQLEINRQEAERSHIYFMYGSDLHETMRNLAICALQPQSEDALKRIEQNIPNREDFLARNFVCVAVFLVPEEEFQAWIDKGLAATCDANENYETLEGERVELPEAVLGEKAIQEAIKNGYITYFGQSHKVFNAVGLGERVFDPFDVFDRSFVPNNSIGLELVVARENNRNIINPYKGTDLEGLYLQIISLNLDAIKEQQVMETLAFANEQTGENRKLAIEAVKDLISGNMNVMGE